MVIYLKPQCASATPQGLSLEVRDTLENVWLLWSIGCGWRSPVRGPSTSWGVNYSDTKDGGLGTGAQAGKEQKVEVLHRRAASHVTQPANKIIRKFHS